MPVRTKNLKAPLGFFLFTDKIKKRENGSQYSVLPKFFANQKNILGSLQKIRSKLHGLLSRRNTASHRCSSLQGLRRSPSAFPFRAVPFGCCQKFSLTFFYFSSFFICSSTFSHCMSPLITQIPAAPVFLTDAAFSLPMPPMA